MAVVRWCGGLRFACSSWRDLDARWAAGAGDPCRLGEADVPSGSISHAEGGSIHHLKTTYASRPPAESPSLPHHPKPARPSTRQAPGPHHRRSLARSRIAPVLRIRLPASQRAHIPTLCPRPDTSPNQTSPHRQTVAHTPQPDYLLPGRSASRPLDHRPCREDELRKDRPSAPVVQPDVHGTPGVPRAHQRPVRAAQPQRGVGQRKGYAATPNSTHLAC